MAKSAKFSTLLGISNGFLRYAETAPKNDINLPSYTL